MSAWKAGAEMGTYVLQARTETGWKAQRDGQTFLLTPLPWADPKGKPTDPWCSLDKPGLADLEVPGLAPMEVVEVGHETWLAQPALEGTPLADALPEGGASRAEVLACARVLSRVLEALHSRNLFHNALSAETVWVGPGGALTLTGWGQPEALATPDERNGHWDLSCLGVLLGEYALGQLSYEGAQRPPTSDDETGFHRRNRVRKVFPRWRDLQDRDLRTLVVDLTDPSSTDAFQNVSELGERLDALMEGDHRLRELETDFDRVRAMLDERDAAFAERFEALRAQQEATLAKAHQDLEAARAELEQERALFKEREVELKLKFRNVWGAIGAVTVIIGTAVGLVVGPGPILTKGELEDALTAGPKEQPGWVLEVVTHGYMEHLMETEDDEKVTWASELVRRSELEDDALRDNP